MIDKRFNPAHPIVVGICGEAGTGKTTLADKLAPPASLGDADKDGLVWDHIFFSAPLYEMASIRRMIEGDDRRDRVLYELHGVLLDLFGGSPLYGAPPFDVLNQITKDVANVPITVEGKPRGFFQEVGNMCRSIEPNCFVKRIERTIKAASVPDDETDHIKVIVVSDVRQENEAEMITAQKNGLLFRLEASEETRIQRLTLRDGKAPDLEQLNVDNTQVLTVPTDLIDHHIDTELWGPDDVANVVREIVVAIVKESANA